MTFFFHFLKLFVSDICVWYNSFTLGNFPWLTFFPHWPTLSTLLLAHNWFLSLFQDQHKGITPCFHMAFNMWFYVSVLELKPCLCTWHCACPCMKCFLSENGKNCRTDQSSISAAFSRIYSHGSCDIITLRPELCLSHSYLILNCVLK